MQVSGKITIMGQCRNIIYNYYCIQKNILYNQGVTHYIIIKAEIWQGAAGKDIAA